MELLRLAQLYHLEEKRKALVVWMAQHFYSSYLLALEVRHVHPKSNIVLKKCVEIFANPLLDNFLLNVDAKLEIIMVCSMFLVK
jgi:hypothetical protein